MHIYVCIYIIISVLIISLYIITLFGKPLWKSFPVVLIVQGIEPPVPIQGCESAVSTQYLYIYTQTHKYYIIHTILLNKTHCHIDQYYCL